MDKMISLNAYSKQQVRNILQESTFQIEILNILNSLQGKVKIHVHQKQPDEIPFEKDFSIHGFSWICPWSIEAILKFQYIELDVTFSILKPYVCAIPQIIINGISLPLGFIAGPQENSSLYGSFYNDIIAILQDASF